MNVLMKTNNISKEINFLKQKNIDYPIQNIFVDDTFYERTNKKARCICIRYDDHIRVAP